MAGSFGLDEAQIISTWMGCITLGTFHPTTLLFSSPHSHMTSSSSDSTGVMLVSFVACMNVLLFTSHKSSSRKQSRRMLTIISVLMTVLAVFNEALQLRHMLDAFIYYQGPGGPTAELEDSAYWVDSTKAVLYVLQTLLGDGMLVSHVIREGLDLAKYQTFTGISLLDGL
jgi:hypothetical protein